MDEYVASGTRANTIPQGRIYSALPLSERVQLVPDIDNAAGITHLVTINPLVRGCCVGACTSLPLALARWRKHRVRLAASRCIEAAMVNRMLRFRLAILLYLLALRCRAR